MLCTSRHKFSFLWKLGSLRPSILRVLRIVKIKFQEYIYKENGFIPKIVGSLQVAHPSLHLHVFTAEEADVEEVFSPHGGVPADLVISQLQHVKAVSSGHAISSDGLIHPRV